MKGIGWYLAGALGLVLLGIGLWKVGRVEGDLAHAEEAIVSEHFADADTSFAEAERGVALLGYLPGIGKGPANAIRTRRAALHYWQGDYDAIVPRQTNPVAGIPNDNVDMQFIVASAVFQARAERAADLQASLQAIEAGIAGYLTVLRNSRRHDDAAYNVEYLARLRGEFEAGVRKELSRNTTDPLGAHGILTDKKPENQNFKVYTPKTSDERNKEGGAGKTPPKPRRG